METKLDPTKTHLSLTTVSGYAAIQQEEVVAKSKSKTIHRRDFFRSILHHLHRGPRCPSRTPSRTNGLNGGAAGPPRNEINLE